MREDYGVVSSETGLIGEDLVEADSGPVLLGGLPRSPSCQPLSIRHNLLSSSIRRLNAKVG